MLIHFFFNKHSGSIQRNACVACKTALCDYQESVTTGQTDTQRDGQTDAGQSDPYVPLCFTGNFWQHSEECMCHLRNIVLCDYQESVTTGQTDGGTDRRQTK